MPGMWIWWECSRILAHTHIHRSYTSSFSSSSASGPIRQRKCKPDKLNILNWTCYDLFIYREIVSQTPTDGTRPDRDLLLEYTAQARSAFGTEAAMGGATHEAQQICRRRVEEARVEADPRTFFVVLLRPLSHQCHQSRSPGHGEEPGPTCKLMRRWIADFRFVSLGTNQRYAACELDQCMVPMLQF